jgi:hypothetical protein
MEPSKHSRKYTQVYVQTYQCTDKVVPLYKVDLQSIVNYDFRLISGRVWIGMYGDNNKQSLSWINGISVEYVEWSTSDPIDWNQSYPNGTLSNTKCVGLDISDNYTFVDPLCTEVLPYLCTGKSVIFYRNTIDPR